MPAVVRPCPEPHLGIGWAAAVVKLVDRVCRRVPTKQEMAQINRWVKENNLTKSSWLPVG